MQQGAACSDARVQIAGRLQRADLPGVPTFAEAGFPGFVSGAGIQLD